MKWPKSKQRKLRLIFKPVLLNRILIGLHARTFFQYSQSKCESEGPNKLSNVKHHFENSTQPVGSAANSILIERPKVADLLDTTVPGWWCWCLKAWLCPLLTACCLGQRMGDKKSWLRYGVTGKFIENATHDTDSPTYIVRPRILK